MSKVIKSSRVKIGEERYIIPATVTIHEDAFYKFAKNKDHRDFDNHGAHDSYDEDEDYDEGYAEVEQNPQEIAEALIDDARNEAASILEDARQSAHAIEADALDQAKTLYDNTYADAFELGKQEGFNEGQSQAQVLIDEALKIKEEWQLQRLNLSQVLEKEAIHLVLSCLEKIMGEAVATPDYVQSIIGVGMKQMAYSESVVVRVCERDYQYAQALQNKVLAMAENIESLEIKLDYALEPGQVYIETTAGAIDVSIQSQVDQVRQMFEALLAE